MAPTATPVPQTATHKPTGTEVTVISSNDGGEFFMVKSVSAGSVFYAHKNQLDYEATEPSKGDTGVSSRRGRRKVSRPVAESAAPSTPRTNLNLATPEALTQVLKGVGIKTAMQVKELQQSLPGEKFRTLDQIRGVGGVDWDIVLADAAVYVE